MKNSLKFFAAIFFVVLAASCSDPGGGGGSGEEEETPLSTYRVYYHADDATSGEAPEDPESYHEGETVTVLGNTGNLVKTGETFTGWHTPDDTFYSPGSTFAMPGNNVDLLANWTTDPTYTVTYDPNSATSGSVPEDGNNYEEGQTVTVWGNTGSLTRTGYIFTGWNTTVEGNGTTYESGDTFPMPSENVTLYAKWEDAYSITYFANGADSGEPPATAYYLPGSEATISYGTSLVKTGYHIASWNTLSGGTGTSYLSGEVIEMPASDIELYAQWEINLYTVAYDDNGATSGTKPANMYEVEHGTVITISGRNTMEKTGCIFTGWDTEDDGSGTGYTPGESHTLVSHLLLFAQWAPGGTLTYDGNGHTTGDPPPAADYGEGVSVTLPEKGTMNKYEDSIIKIFKGWNTAANGSGTLYQAGDPYTMPAANVTLYAQWTAVGADGPGGGKIFYEKSAYSDGWRYMEANYDDMSSVGVEWDYRATFTSIAGTSSAIGSGQANTTAIVNALGTATYAAYLCDDHVGSWEPYPDDWFLPSRDELVQMYQGLKAAGLGNFADAYYWSSTQYDTNNAYHVNFENGAYGTTMGNKGNTFRVRAARRF